MKDNGYSSIYHLAYSFFLLTSCILLLASCLCRYDMAYDTTYARSYDISYDYTYDLSYDISYDFQPLKKTEINPLGFHGFSNNPLGSCRFCRRQKNGLRRRYQGFQYRASVATKSSQ